MTAARQLAFELQLTSPDMVDSPQPAGFPRCPQCPLRATASPHMSASASLIQHASDPISAGSQPIIDPAVGCGNPICNWDDEGSDASLEYVERLR